jgi:rSAM/selenodomain-associated transferase 1
VNARDVSLVVLAKAPYPGRVKTRLCPPCTPDEAAILATAALTDTLTAVAAVGACRHILVLDGQPGRWLPAGFEVVAQRGDGLDERLGAAFDAVGGPALLVGMDTPQITATLLESAARTLVSGRRDAVLGRAHDGGYWCIGLRRPDTRVFDGVPMSTGRTGRTQLERLHELGLDVALLPRVRDVDTFDDARAVAREAPASRFAAAVASVGTRSVGPWSIGPTSVGPVSNRGKESVA